MHARSSPSLWQKTTPQPRYSALTGSHSADVVIVGAGITGLTSAYLLNQSGRLCTVLDMGEVASGETARTTAHITAVLDTRYADLISRLGVETAWKIAQSQRLAIETIRRTIRTENIPCQFESVKGYLYALQESQRPELEAEYQALLTVGFSCKMVNSTPLPFPVVEAIEIEEQAQINPLCYCFHLAERLTRLGVKIYTNSVVRDFDDGARCRVVTDDGEVFAEDVIVATHVPISNRVFLHTKLASYRSYVLEVQPGGLGIPQGLFWDMETPYHYMRSYRQGEQTTLIVGGADHKTGTEDDTEKHFRKLENYLTSCLPFERVVSRWSGQITETVDGLPLIGKNPVGRNLYVATGFSGNGMTHGTLSATILHDLIVNGESEWEQIYDPARLPSFSRLSWYMKENKDYPFYLLRDRLLGELRHKELRPGEGQMLRIHGRSIAVYRKESGELTAFSAVCPHLGCLVHWNQVETSWDCPCHGSRFDIDGKVLNGPACTGLQSVPIEESRKDISA